MGIIGFGDKGLSSDEKNLIEQTLAEDEGILRCAQDEQGELVPTAKGLGIILEPCEDVSKIKGFIDELMAYAGMITQSITLDGKLTSRFVVAISSDLRRQPYVVLSCFNREFEMVEFGMVATKAELLAVKYGLRIVKINETPDVVEVEVAGEGAKIAHVREESGVEVQKNGRRIVGRIIFPDGRKCKMTAVVNNQFSRLSETAILSIMVIIGMSQMQGQDPGRVCQKFLSTNPKLVELMTRRNRRQYDIEVISVEDVPAENLEQLIHGKSFAFLSEPEA